MQLSTSEQKKMAHNLITFTDSVDEKGGPVPRGTFRKNLFAGFDGLRKALLNDVLVGVLRVEGGTKEKFTMEQVVWVQSKDLTDQDTRMAVMEKFSENPIELTDKMVEVLRWCMSDRDEMPREVSGETVTFFSTL